MKAYCSSFLYVRLFPMKPIAVNWLHAWTKIFYFHEWLLRKSNMEPNTGAP